MNIPKELKYTREHEWVKKINDTTVLVGITDYAQGELGELVYVEIDILGEKIEQDDVFGTVEAVKTTSELFMPVDGEIIAFNPEIDEEEKDNAAVINEDPYGKGWIIKIKMTNPEQFEELLSPKEYEELIS